MGRGLLERGRRLEALDVFDSLVNPPPELVWDAALPEVEAHLAAQAPELGLEVLERPSLARLRAAGDGTRPDPRVQVAQLAVEKAAKTSRALKKRMVSPDPREVQPIANCLRITVMLGSRYRMPTDTARMLISNAPLFMRSRALGEPTTRISLAVAELRLGQRDAAADTLGAGRHSSPDSRNTGPRSESASASGRRPPIGKLQVKPSSPTEGTTQ